MSLADDGYEVLPSADPASCRALDTWLREQRKFDRSLFLTEAEFDADPQWVDVNPKPGRNVLEDDASPPIGILHRVEWLADWLGDFFTVFDRKVVCGVPLSEIPDWVKERTKGRAVNNLGPFVKPDYRDITYFAGIDWHQDIIDFPGREPDFLTLYVYLSDVGHTDAPVCLVAESHLRGPETFPHDTRGCWHERILGPPGTTAAWHPYTLHETLPVYPDRQARLSLRYLITGKGGKLAELNKRIGSKAIEVTRHDLAADGSPLGSVSV